MKILGGVTEKAEMEAVICVSEGEVFRCSAVSHHYDRGSWTLGRARKDMVPLRLSDGGSWMQGCVQFSDSDSLMLCSNREEDSMFHCSIVS